MSELQVIEGALKRAAHRRRLERAWRGFWQGLLAGGLLWLLVFAAYKVFPIPHLSLTVAGIVAGVTLLTFVTIGGWRKPSLQEMARWVDSRQHLQERLSTALEISGSSTAARWKELIVTDAAQHAKSLDPRQLLPFRFPVVSRWALLVVLLGGGLGFVPEYRSKSHLQKQADTANIRDTGKHLAEFTRRNLEQRPPSLEPTQKAMEAVAELGTQLGKQTLTKSEALRDLTSITDKLSQEAKELGQNPALKPLERAARESGGSGMPSPGELQKQIQDLQKALGGAAGDPDKLDKLQKDLQKLQQAGANLPSKESPAGAAAQEQMSQALSELAQQARDMGASLPALEEAIAALKASQTDTFLKNLDAALKDVEKMKELAKAMQQLQQQAAKLGKDLPEQLKNGQAQAAQATLQKMIEDLKSANLSKEQLQKILDEVSKSVDPASEYGKAAEHLKKAAEQMQKGQKPDAAQSLADASKELEELMKQMQDAQSLQATLEALQRAQMAIAMGKGWGECNGPGCKACNGLGCWQCLNKKPGRSSGKGGKPGGGVGTWADETGWTYFQEDAERYDNSGVNRPDTDPRAQTDRGEGDLNPNMTPTKIKGQMSPGGSMQSIPLKGVSIKGTSSVAYEEAASAAQDEAQSALSQDQVPRAYRGAVRDYFDDLKK